MQSDTKYQSIIKNQLLLMKTRSNLTKDLIFVLELSTQTTSFLNGVNQRQISTIYLKKMKEKIMYMHTFTLLVKEVKSIK